MKIKYLATYNGPSYGGWDSYEQMDAFSSIEDARQAMSLRQGGHDYVTTYKENDDNFYVPWSRGQYTEFPGTTTEDRMDLYLAVDLDDGEYSRGDDPMYRLTVGPRGGIKVEKW